MVTEKEPTKYGRDKMDQHYLVIIDNMVSEPPSTSSPFPDGVVLPHVSPLSPRLLVLTVCSGRDR